MRKETNVKKTNFKIYAIGLISIAIILGIGVLYYNLNKSSNYEVDTEQFSKISNQLENNIIIENTAEQASVQIGKSVEEVENENNISNITNTTEKIALNTSSVNNTVKEDTNTTKENTEKEAEVEAKEELSFSMPVDGEIIKEFARDTLLYSATLNEWTTHLGIDIKAEKTTVVKASEKGTVKYIKNDPRYGLSIVIEHNDGYTTIYSNLLTSEFVVEGEKVEKGQTIGTVGNTAVFEIADESHLHFEILKDNSQVDPKLYIK